MGTVYLLHFDKKYNDHAGHYLGYADNLQRRLWHHAHGSGANLMRVIKEAGIGWVVARTWEGDRKLERRLKNWHKAPQLCPICRAEAKGESYVPENGDRGLPGA